MKRMLAASLATMAALALSAAPAEAATTVVSNSPIVGMAGTPTSAGYWQVASDGGVFNFGDAKFFGSAGGQHLSAPVVGMAGTPSAAGYWLVASDGGVFSYGDAPFYGSMGGQHLNAPVVGMAATPSGHGYYLVGSDGGIFAYGDAGFYGSMGGQHLNKPVVGVAATPSGRGYWLVAADGGIFAYGDAGFYGSAGSLPLNAPIVGMSRTASGRGYWLVAADGGIFAYGDAVFSGSAGSLHLAMPVSGMATAGTGYWLTARDGGLFSYGGATFAGHAVYTGSPSSGTGSTAAQLAQSLLASSATFATVHPSGVKDNANAKQNMVDTAAGKPASRSCYGTAPCGTINLKVTMLQAMLQITRAATVRVSEIAGASHTRGSLHYQGTAFDIDLINGVGGPGNTIGHAQADPLVAICHSQGAQQYWLEMADGTVAGANAKGNHVHCGWSPSVA